MFQANIKMQEKNILFLSLLLYSGKYRHKFMLSFP